MSLTPAVVASSRAEAAAAATAIFRQGGNAIDAGVAAIMVQCVIEPSNVSFAGYGGSMMIHHAATGRIKAIDFDSRAPAGFRADRFTEEDANFGYLAMGVPGIVSGLDRALSEYGTLPWKTVSQPALAIAENGIVVTPDLHADFRKLLRRIDATSYRAFFPTGIPAVGERWIQKDLARLIHRLGDEGPRSFYEGDIAHTIVRQIQANGGELSEDDLRNFHAIDVEPLHTTYRGFDLYTPPPPSGGLTSIAILKTLEQFDIASLEPWGARYWDLYAQAAKLCWQERFRTFGDPEFVQIPVDQFLSTDSAVARAKLIRDGQVPPAAPLPTAPPHTVNVLAVDKDHNAISITATHGGDFGSHVAIDGLGLMLGHGMSRFAFKQPSPNYPAPGKRMQHNMSPTLVFRDGKPYAAVGLPGGRMIVTVTAQLIASLVDFHADPLDAVNGPRIHIEADEPLLISPEVTDDVAAELALMGHTVQRRPNIADEANIIRIDENLTAAASSGPEGVANVES